MKGRTFHVQTTSFSGVWGGGMHTYVNVREYLPDKSFDVHEITREISAGDARALNKIDSWGGWAEGMKSARFDSEAAAKAAAQEWLDENTSPADEVFWGLDFYKGATSASNVKGTVDREDT